MASNYNKIIYAGTTLIDLTEDTVTASNLKSGLTAHDKSGAIITGTNTYDADTTDATAYAAEILDTRTAYARGQKITGTMPNNGAIDENISTLTQKITIANGFHDGSGTVGIASTEQAKLIPKNIREGVTVLGILGTMSSSEAENPESGKEVTPTTSDQTILPSTNYTCFKEITVKAIPYTQVENAAGGYTATIG